MSDLYKICNDFRENQMLKISHYSRSLKLKERKISNQGFKSRSKKYCFISQRGQ